ncbi:MAG TPA: hypothetical protein DEB09_01015 [Candidatus Magasanikbacteria bacterium]|nr:hypothetical protein [Candidatus Magasanikbacteria bacterium]
MNEFISRIEQKTKADDARENKERGKNTHVKVMLVRHEEREGKTDIVGEEGKKRIESKAERKIDQLRNVPPGEEIKQYILIKGGKDTKRARHSAQIWAEALAKEDASQYSDTDQKRQIEVINKSGGKYTPDLNEFGIYGTTDLDEIAKGKKVGNLVRERWLVENPGGDITKVPYDYVVQGLLETPEQIFEENGIEKPTTVASRIAHSVNSGINISRNIYPELDMVVANFSHSPGIEIFLHRVGIFNKIEEIGGAINYGEEIEIDIRRDEKGQLVEPMNVNFPERGKTFTIDMEKFKKLIEDYKPKQN